MSLTPADVRHKQFGTTRLRPGYVEEEVDAFLDEVEAALDRLIQENEELRAKLAEVLRGGGKPAPALSSPSEPPPERRQPAPVESPLLTPADVRHKQFGTTRLQPGYVEEEVDAFLDEVEAALDRLIQENEELRAKLAEVLRGGGKPAIASLASPLSEPEPEMLAPEPAMMAPEPSLEPRQSDSSMMGVRPNGSRSPRAEPVAEPPRSRRHWLDTYMPAGVPVNADVSLLVRVGTDPSDIGGGRVQLRDFETGPGAMPVTVIAQARRGLSPTGPLEQVLVVPETGDSDPVRFTFRAEQAGLFKIRVSAFAGGTFLGELATELSVGAAGRLAGGRVRTAALEPIRAEPGEVTLQVRFDGEQYTFQLLSESYLFEPVIAQALTARPG